MSQRASTFFSCLFISFFLLIPASVTFASANGETDTLTSVQQMVWKQAFDASFKGPELVPLIDQGALQLPKGYCFIPKQEATDLMELMGNRVSDAFLGLVIPSNDNADWMITVNFIHSGYVKDDEANSWNVDDLLEQFKQGTQEANKERKDRGMAPIKVIGWIEKPRYNAVKHIFIWSIAGREEGNNRHNEDIINYGTYALGREGYFKLTLLTSSQAVNKDKVDAQKIIDAVSFHPGKAYEDYNVKTDKVAAYGLAALVTGVVAKKLGLLALAGFWVVKLWKLIIFVPLLLASKIKNIFKRKD